MAEAIFYTKCRCSPDDGIDKFPGPANTQHPLNNLIVQIDPTMKRLNTHEVVPGMVLEAPVLDQKGRFLIPAGETVTEQHIRICKIWGATEIWIKSSDTTDLTATESISQIPDDVWIKAEELAQEAFSCNELDEPFMQKVFQLAVQQKARKICYRNGLSKHETTPAPSQNLKIDPYIPPGKSQISLQSLINERMKLPSLPDIYNKTMASIYNADVPIADIAQIISKDTTLSAKVLQLVNSSFYGLLKPVETLPHALALIGTDQLLTIVNGVSVVSVFKDLSSSMLNMRQFWEHSVACGIVCRQLASYMDGIVNSERYFVAGLLHDIGRLVMIQAIADDMAGSMAKARVKRCPLVWTEKETLGFDHAQAGAYLSKTWNLPVTLEQMIRYHHEPLSVHQNNDPAVVAVADFLVTALQIGSSGNAFLPCFSREIWERLDLNPNILDNVVFQLESQLNDTFVLIYGTSIHDDE